MKTIYIYILSFISLGLFLSCEDFLTLYPTNQITEEQFWEDKSHVEQVMMSCYVELSSSPAVRKMIEWGEMRSDNLAVRDLKQEKKFNIKRGILLASDDIFDWGVFYSVINRCNTLLANGENVLQKDPSFSKSEWEAIQAEAKAIRALSLFYLIRSFKDVPRQMEVLTTDDGVEKKGYVGVTPALELLNELISDLEEYKDKARIDYGGSVFTKGRFTRRGIYTLLADLYLWRGALLQPSPISNIKKAYADTTSSGEKYKADYNKVIELTNWVIEDIKVEKQKREKYSLFNGSDENSKTWLLSQYPLIQPAFVLGDYTTDRPYDAIFGIGNSSESIFELQYDGKERQNNAIKLFYEGGSSKGPKDFIGDPATFKNPAEILPNGKGFGKLDLRFASTFYLEKSIGAELGIVKYTATNVTNINAKDVANLSPEPPTYELREPSALNANWIIYRLSDVMLMKAEAIARLKPENNSSELKEGFFLTQAILLRSNPNLYPFSVTSENIPNELKGPENGMADTTFYRGKNADALLNFVYDERQREFVGEGKRWYDLVRMAEADGTTEKALEKMGVERTIKIRLRELSSFYNPIYEEDLKINKNLVQNPSWKTAE